MCCICCGAGSRPCDLRMNTAAPASVAAVPIQPAASPPGFGWDLGFGLGSDLGWTLGWTRLERARLAAVKTLKRRANLMRARLRGSSCALSSHPIVASCTHKPGWDESRSASQTPYSRIASKAIFALSAASMFRFILFIIPAPSVATERL